MTRSRTVIIILLYMSILTCLLILASCSNNNTDNCSVKVQSLQETLRLKDQRIAALEDSLQKVITKNNSLPSAASLTDPAPGNTTIDEESLYKKGQNGSNKLTEKASAKFPGQFPEGSARIIGVRDVQFLSEWGLKIMLNEIYARHGMVFTEEALQKHFNRSNWYKSSGKTNIESKLSKIEKQNIRYLKNYKYSPQIPA